MKKTLLALAVLSTFAGTAFAQTSITIYGSIDGGVRSQTNVDAAGHNKQTVSSNGTYNSNRLGFKGVEDLGGGMNAHFNLESGFNTGTGTLDNPAGTLFNRLTIVGLGGSWGAVDLGRNYTVAFKTIGAYDPLGYKFPGIALAIPATAGVRYNNDIQYTGTFGPVTARAEYALGEQPGDAGFNTSKAIGASYTQGPISAGAAYTNRDVAGFDNKHWTVGGAFKFGMGRVAVGYADQKQETAIGIDTKNKWMWVGVGFAASPALEITPAYYRNKQEGGAAGALVGKKDIFMLSAAYALSKRTSLYALIDQARLEDALLAFGHDRQRDIAVGVNHNF